MAYVAGSHCVYLQDSYYLTLQLYTDWIDKKCVFKKERKKSFFNELVRRDCFYYMWHANVYMI